MIVVSIDPGMSGALACFVDGELIEVVDMPTFEDDNRRRTVNAAEVARQLERWADLGGIASPSVVIEQVHAIARSAAKSAFAFGDAFGVVRAVPVALGYPTHFVRPVEWKRGVGLPIRSNKDASRKLASYLYPTHAERFARVKDDGRAEAVLIGSWWGS